MKVCNENCISGSHALSPDPATVSEESSESFCVHGYTSVEKNTGAISTPIFLSSTFAHPELGVSTGYDYSRCLNPTRFELEQTVAVLEHCSYALAFSSGMNAISTVLKYFNPEDEIIVSDDLYGGTYRIFELYSKYGIKAFYADTSNLNEIKKIITPKTKGIFIETPSNPTMKTTSIKDCADLIHENNGILIVDNTFLSPYLQNPKDFGADVIVHSGTKFLSGHHDVLCGFLVYDKKELDDFFRFIQISEGGVLSPFDSFLVLRGIKTLCIRLEKAEQNAQKIVDFLSNNPNVKKVYYPSLLSGVQKKIYKTQARGNGAMISFTVSSAEKASQVLKKLHLILFAESLGGVQSLITYPVSQTHNFIPKEMREKVGVTDSLLRLSVGIENPTELIADLEQALT
jgi:cystathionine gamma-synthase